MNIANEPIDNYRTGWIKLFRSIKTNWVWKNERYLKAWLTIILTVNFEDKKELIDGELIECKRGQSIYSLNSWCNIFGHNWSIQKVRTFFKLLEKDSMIVTEGLRKTTRLTVCNYDSYQNDQQTDNTQITHSQHAANRQVTTTKELKNDKKEKNNIDSFFLFWEHYHKTTGKQKTDKDSAIKYWNKLSITEQRKAYVMVKPYFDSLQDKKYCKKARTYLADKNYNDEISSQSTIDMQNYLKSIDI